MACKDSDELRKMGEILVHLFKDINRKSLWQDKKPVLECIGFRCLGRSCHIVTAMLEQ